MADDSLPAPKDLTESSALIVGGAAGVGLASARALVAAAVPRIVIAERGQLATKSIAELVATAHFIAADATDPEAAATITAEAEQILSGIDILMCTTAADIRPELFINIPTADIGLGIAQLALPSMHPASAVLPGMRSRRGGVTERGMGCDQERHSRRSGHRRCRSRYRDVHPGHRHRGEALRRPRQRNDTLGGLRHRLNRTHHCCRRLQQQTVRPRSPASSPRCGPPTTSRRWWYFCPAWPWRG